jgi:hypothetical protein
MAMYEYCNLYLYLVQLQMLMNFDYAFITELFTRMSMVLASQTVPFFEDIQDIFQEQNIDFFLLGFREGIIVKQVFDISFD